MTKCVEYDIISSSERYFYGENMLENDLMYKLFKVSKNKKDPMDEIRKLNSGENGILKTLYFYEENEKRLLTPSELCRIQHLTSGRIATALKSLERKLYIIRHTDEIDHRKILIKLTELGKKVAKKIFNKINSNIQKIINQLGEHDANEYVRILSRLLDL